MEFIKRTDLGLGISHRGGKTTFVEALRTWLCISNCTKARLKDFLPPCIILYFLKKGKASMALKSLILLGMKTHCQEQKRHDLWGLF